MRKFSLALLALLMVAAMASAEPIGTEWTLEAEASASFGINLDKASDGTGTVDGPTTGFMLENDIDLEVEFIEEQTKEFGEGKMYGYIEIEDFEIIMAADGVEETAPALEGTNGEITAKVFLGPAYIVVATAENDIDEAGLSIGVDESILGLDDKITSTDAGNSVAVGFDVQDMVNIELVLASVGGLNGLEWDGGTAVSDPDNATDADDSWAGNLFNNYKGAILTETTIDALTITLDLSAPLRTHYPKDDAADYTETDSAGDFGDNGFIGIGLEYEMPLDEMMTLIPFLGVDLLNDATAGESDDSNSGREGAFDYEVAVGANIEWGADDLEIFAEASDETQGGVGLEVGLGKNTSAATGSEENSVSYMWVRAGLAEEGGDDGLFPVIGAAVLVEYETSTTTSAGTEGDAVNKVAFGAEVDADLGEISPFFGLMYADTNLDEDNSEDDGIYSEGLTMKVGTDINIVPATTFTIEYTSGNLLLDGDGVYDATDGYYSYEAARGASTATAKSGTFTIKTTVEY